MKQNVVSRLAAVAFALSLCAGLLAGCANPAATAANAEQQANRAYMSQVNEIMEELGDELGSFVDAVSRNDIVNMRTQAQNAYRSLDKLADLEAPEILEDVQDGYMEGTAQLREALDEYVDLYTEMSSSSFDWSSYDERIARIQSLYDEGVQTLADTDELAAGKD